MRLSCGDGQFNQNIDETDVAWGRLCAMGGSTQSTPLQVGAWAARHMTFALELKPAVQMELHCLDWPVSIHSNLIPFPSRQNVGQRQGLAGQAVRLQL